MPNHKAHLAIGFLSAGIVLALFIYFQKPVITPLEYIWIIVFTAIYSLLPDIDHRMSKIRHYFFIIFFIILIFLTMGSMFMQDSELSFFQNMVINYLAIAGLAVVGLAVLFLRHRGITHRYSIGAFICIPLFIISFPVFLAGLASYWSHLIADGIKKL